jgi:DNA-binding LacI/PurR family transcriptional regulator
MRTPVTLQQIANQAGVSLTTAARAIRNNPLVRPKTAVRIRALAKELGYSPDPMLAALNAYRHATRTTQPQGTIAWVTNYSTRHGWSGNSGTCFELYRDGAAEQLARHGYRLDDFWLREPGLTAKRASRILFNRGILGLLICPLENNRGHLSLDWEKFSAVTFGYTMSRPKLHLFTSAHYHAMVTSIRKLRALGYRKIGLATAKSMEERMDQMWAAAYHSQLAVLPESRSLPIFVHRRPLGMENQAAFEAWYKRHRPEAVISTFSFLYKWMTERNSRVFDECGFAATTLLESEQRCAGIIESSRQIGRAAADFLVGMIQRGERGIPEFPQHILVEGRWVDGSTITKNAPRRSVPVA